MTKYFQTEYWISQKQRILENNKVLTNLKPPYDTKFKTLLSKRQHLNLL